MIIRTRNQGNLELRSAFALTDTLRWGYQGLRNIRQEQSVRDVRGIPALHRAFRLRSETIASLQLGCYRGKGVDRQQVTSVWQAKLFAKPRPNPLQTRFSFWETAEESLCYRGNSFLWKTIDKKRGSPTFGQVLEWYALHPDQVTVEKDGSYTVIVAPGFIDPTGAGPAKYTGLDESTILHIRGHGDGGQLVAPSPIQVFREKFAAPIGRQRHESRMWRRGTAIQQVIVFPSGVSKSQADTWKEGWRGQHEGTDGDTTVVLGDGAELKPIGMTMADAQFVAMAHLTIEDAALIAAMPADMLGIPLTTRQPDMEDVRREWFEDGLNPELFRIEGAVYADLDLFGASQTYPQFDTDGFVRGDNLTESQIVQGDVQAGILTPNEGRALRGYGPLPEGDKLQLTPVGGAPNPNLKLAPPKTPASPGEEPDG